MRTLTISLIVASVALAVVEVRSVEACGGCLSPPEEVTTVESHRMAIALGVEETILWDQIIYTGDPEDFVWVLPVTGPEVSVELADPTFFDWLDGQTAPIVQPLNPVRTFCPDGSSGSGFGCGASADLAGGGDGDGDGDGDSDGVEVSNHEVVGPYETVTITAEDPDALYTWLLENGYQVSEEAFPIIDDYVGAGFSFVALRLAPGEGVSAMQPVRIRYPSYMGTFPLKMVVVGARGVLNLSLWVIAEQRYGAFNYGTVELDPNRITWDWASSRSDYNEVFSQIAEENGNRSWIAEYAARLSTLGLPPVEAMGDFEEAQRLVSSPYVTRLRAEVLVDHVDEDLILAPSEDSTDIGRFLLAGLEVNRPAEPDCDDGSDSGIACRSGDSHRSAGGSLLLLGLAIAFAYRRRA
jgi:MYXO-CTERM domain-containing protein